MLGDRSTANRPLIAVVIVTGLVGLALMASLAPDTGPEISRAPAPVVVAPVPRPPGVVHRSVSADAPTDALPTGEIGDEDVAFGPRPFRQPREVPPIDRDQVFAAEARGLASAAVVRREAWQVCWDTFAAGAADPGYEGRITVKITLSPGEDGGRADTEVVNGPEDPGFRDCMGEVMADARFEDPPHDVTMVWPVPIRTE